MRQGTIGGLLRGSPQCGQSRARRGHAWQDGPVRQGVVSALLGCALLLTACSEPELVPQPPLDGEAAAPSFDPGLEPAAAVMALVPESATTLVVTDYDELRFRLGAGDLTSDSPGDDRRTFWKTVEREAVLLSPGLLRPVDQTLRSTYGFGQDDVKWEARFATPTGEGWVIALSADVDLDAFQRAIDGGQAPVAGSTIDRARALVSLGTTEDASTSWAADPDRLALVGASAASTYVDSECVPYGVAFPGGEESDLAAAPSAEVKTLDELGAFSVTFGLELITARLGVVRNDMFERARLPEILPRTDPDFALGYIKPVADPSGGRIGYRLGDPQVAARLALERRLPFAVCAS